MKWFTLILLAVLSPLAPAQLGAHSLTDPSVPYQWANGVLPVLEYDVHSGMPRGLSDTPRLRIYADGAYVVFFSRFSRFAGSYYGQMDPRELASWLQRVVASGIVDNNLVELKTRREKMATQAHMLFDISDQTLTTLKVRLGSVSGLHTSGNPAAITEKSFRWKNLRSDTRLFPQLRELTAMQGLVDQLESLCKVGRLNKVVIDE